MTFTKNNFYILLLLLFGSISLAFAQQTEKIYLSGESFEAPVKWDFMVTDGMNSNKWSKINVPNQWELEGFGTYTYGRWYKELNQDEPSKEEGFYKYEFEVPQSYKGKAVK